MGTQTDGSGPGSLAENLPPLRVRLWRLPSDPAAVGEAERVFASESDPAFGAVHLHGPRMVCADDKDGWSAPRASGRGFDLHVCWSGALGGSGSGGLFEEVPARWLPDAQSASRDRLEAAARSAAEAGVVLGVRPHERHAISDLPSAVWIGQHFGEWEGRPLRVVLDPASMLHAEYAHTAEDHYRRCAEVGGYLASLGMLAGIVVSSARRAGGGLMAAAGMRAAVDDGYPHERPEPEEAAVVRTLRGVIDVAPAVFVVADDAAGAEREAGVVLGG